MRKKTFIFLLLLVSGVFAQNGNQEVTSQFRRGLDFYFINGFGVAYKFGMSTSDSRTIYNSKIQLENADSGWNKESDYNLGVGAFISVETKIIDFLSLFAESSISAGKSCEYSKYSSESEGSIGASNYDAFR